ncbi:MAG: glycosyltransferase [Actinomycetota bacterium]
MTCQHWAVMPDPQRPDVSVAVSTYNRARLLPRLLDALSKQSLPYDHFEVVVVDDCSPDDTPTVLQELEHHVSFALRVIRLEQNAGPAKGRNVAWGACHGDVIAFTDDDCQPTERWLENGLRAIDKPGICVVVGKTAPNPDQLSNLGAFSRTLWVNNARFFQTCNTFYRRADLEAVGGLDETFPSPGGEDTDLGWRVCALRGEAAFSEGALVYHDVRPSDFRATVRETLRWDGVPHVIAKHGSRARHVLFRRLFWKRTHPRLIFAVAGMILARIHPIALVLCVPWIALRMIRRPGLERWPTRIGALPGLFVIDLLEIFVMVRGSVRHKTIVL